MPFLTQHAYLDYDISFIGTNTYDVTAIPSNELKLTANDGSSNDLFGYSVAVGSGRIVICSYNDDIGANTSQGSAYIYDLNGNYITKITASDGASTDYFGQSVAIGSGRIVVGAQYDDIGANTSQGSAYIYDLNGNYITKITANDGAALDYFGCSVSIGAGRIVVGALGDDIGAIASQGSAYIYDLNGNYITKITASDGEASDFFGVSVAIGSGRIVVGASGDDIGAITSPGSAYIYDLNGNYITKITAGDGGLNDFFGFSVAVGSGRIVVGAYSDDIGSASNRGSAYIYDLNGNYITKITASDGDSSDVFGYSVAVGLGRIIIGAYGKNASRGVVYIYDLNGNQITQISASDGLDADFFGYSVAIGSGRIVVGASKDDIGANTDQGATYIYTIPDVYYHFLDILDDI